MRVCIFPPVMLYDAARNAKPQLFTAAMKLSWESSLLASHWNYAENIPRLIRQQSLASEEEVAWWEMNPGSTYCAETGKFWMQDLLCED